jgi:hypothetical protein
LNPVSGESGDPGSIGAQLMHLQKKYKQIIDAPGANICLKAAESVDKAPSGG